MRKKVWPQLLIVFVVVAVCLAWCINRYTKEFDTTIDKICKVTIIKPGTGGAAAATREVEVTVTEKEYASANDMSGAQFIEMIGKDYNDELALQPGEKIDEAKLIKKTTKVPKIPINLGLDLKGGVHLVLECNPGSTVEPKPDEVAGVRKVMLNRLDPNGVREVAIQSQGNKFINIDVPGEKDPDQVAKLIGQTAKLEFLYFSESKEENDVLCAPGVKSTPDKVCIERATTDQCAIAARPKKDEGCVVITGADLKSSNADFNSQDGTPSVGFELKKEASDRFFKFTQRHASEGKSGKQEYLVVVFDGKVISSPYMKSAIFGGKGQIEGKFTRDQVKDLVDWLNAGALPVPVSIVEMRAVSPTLGQDSLKNMLIAGIWGFCLITVLMIGFYRLPGVISIFALALYCIIVFGIMSMLNTSLTLPGIAGFIISVGMAVDANVLIFERLKEELRWGKTLRAGIDAGFARAFVTVIDSHVTTLISTAVLYAFGSGPIRGFAVTLTIGVLMSLFSALTITRVVLMMVINVPAAQKLPLYGVKSRNTESAA